MTLETAEAMLRAYFATPQPVYSFGWQGGEPTLMGIDFFREVLTLQRRLAPPGARIANGLQTNGSLLTAEWAALFREYDVLVGLSIDGPQEIHNAHRHWAARVPLARGRAGSDDKPGAARDTGIGTHDRVERCARLLRAEKVAFNALTVVGAHNEDHPLEVYDYLRSLGIRHMQFIPLVEWGASSSYSVSPEGWGTFLKAIFDRWYPRDVRRVSIRHHDSVLELLALGRYNVCTMSGSCGGHLVVEHTGDIFPCDFYVEWDLRLGNVRDEGTDNPLVAAESSRLRRTFRKQKARWDAECAGCDYLRFCGGDCPKMRPSEGTSHLCEGWRAFYGHTLERFRGLARLVQDERAERLRLRG